MNTIDERCYGYEPAASQLKALRVENAALRTERDKILRLWLDDADPAECGYNVAMEGSHDRP